VVNINLKHKIVTILTILVIVIFFVSVIGVAEAKHKSKSVNNKKNVNSKSATGNNQTNITNSAPVIIVFPAVPTKIIVGQNVSFTWEATDADNDYLSWSVNWGDGTGIIGTCPSSSPNTVFTATHAWSKPKKYTVQTTVSDCKGGSDIHTFTINVQRK
jgi:hypothetical protein